MVEPGARPPRVCYVDGDPDRRARFVAVAESDASLAVDAVPDGSVALDRLEADDRPAECLVTVQDLPDATGVDLVRAVRERDADRPVVLHPATGSERLLADATAAGAAGYVPQTATDAVERVCRQAVTAVERYRRGRDLARDAGMLETALTEFPAHVYFKDREGRHVRVSESIPESDRLLGRTDVEAYGPDKGAETLADDRRVLETGEAIRRLEESFVTGPDEDAKRSWYLTTKAPRRDDEGTIVGLIGVTHDVTEFKVRQRELERRRDHLDRFARYVAADLRTPVAEARSTLDRAIETGDEDRLEAVDDALDRVDDRIDDLLLLTRRSEDEVALGSVAFADVAAGRWDAFEPDDATLTVTVPTETRIQADGGQLTELLGHLYRNALEHAGPDVAITVGVTDRGFFVEDDGPGIPSDERDDVIEYGYSRRSAGTGTGLAIVEEIAERHGWTVSVGDGAAGGARFEVDRCLLVARPDVSAGGERVPVDLSAGVDVGGATPPGETVRDGDGAWTLHGGGRNLWNDVEECYFASELVEGDANLVCRVADFEPADEWSKAGVMIRDDLRAGSPLGYVGLSGEHGSELLWRREAGDAIASRRFDRNAAAPHWYRIDRVGTVLTCYTSSDGQRWQPIDQRSVRCTGPIRIGLVCCSRNPTQRSRAAFDAVTIRSLDPR